METNTDLDICINIIKDMLVKNKPVTFVSDNYVRFKDLITKYVYDNCFDETLEWKTIKGSMIYVSNQYLSANSANKILLNLESLKMLNYKNKQEERLFDRHMHMLISKVCKEKYFKGQYADAVESAYKEINFRCKKICKIITGEEFDGADLMHKLFSPNKPILLFEDISTESGKNVQTGYMKIFAGSISAIRNPKAHENQKIDKERAYKKLILASLLMDKLDEAEKYTNANDINIKE